MKPLRVQLYKPKPSSCFWVKVIELSHNFGVITEVSDTMSPYVICFPLKKVLAYNAASLKPVAQPYKAKNPSD